MTTKETTNKFSPEVRERAGDQRHGFAGPSVSVGGDAGEVEDLGVGRVAGEDGGVEPGGFSDPARPIMVEGGGHDLAA